MLAITEAFDAMTSDRAYRQRRTLDAAVEEIRDQAGKQFDPQFADLLTRVVSEQRAIWQAHVARALAIAAGGVAISPDP